MQYLQDLSTPCALLDKTRMQANLERMLVACTARKANFRPHLKTLKSPDAARFMLDASQGRATVSTLKEAEVFGAHGYTDILYAVGITPQKLQRVADIIQEGIAITVILDSTYMADCLALFCQTNNITIPALIELDLDGHRSGVPFADEQRLCEIAKTLQPQNLLKGLIAHAGESYGLSDATALAAMAKLEADQTCAAAQVLRDAGYACEVVSIGSTPTALSGDIHPEVTELRAGVFTFFDLVQTGIGVCSTDDIALSVLTSVISVDLKQNRLITDAGWMALSSDRGTAKQVNDWGYGRVCLEDGTLLPDIYVAWAQQEHGIITAKAGTDVRVPDIPIGTRLRILPNHACATATQHGCYHVLGDNNEVTDIWERFSGW